MATVTPDSTVLRPGGRALFVGFLVVGVGGAIATALGAVALPGRAAAAWLAAYATVASTAMGALVLHMIGYAANARWMASVRRLMDGVVGVFPALIVLFVPIVVAVEYLYPWADPAATWAPHEAHVLHEKRAWLNLPGFAIRGVLYLAVCTVAAELLVRRSRRRDAIVPPPPGEPEITLTTDRAIASALLPAVGLALSFAAFDWLMTLQPLWVSTMFGVYYFAGGFLAGIAVIAILAAWARIGADGVITPHHFHALGRLLLAFTVFWAYCAYFQAFLIRIADRPQEVAFYIARLRGGWEVFVWILVVGHFALPFLLLLPRRPKLRPRWVAGIAAYLLVMHFLDVYWLVLPATGRLMPHWLDLAALAAVVGLCGAFALLRLRGAPLVAVGDPFLPDGARYKSPT
ncbi:MAG TPA: hypothetical protein VM734_28160 [Kofleriaceae bacterium]|nr:hypothetical protein [Kofleriaceae bacterium]